jgi:predicted DNA binding CopG/RHH family protein
MRCPVKGTLEVLLERKKCRIRVRCDKQDLSAIKDANMIEGDFEAS